MNILFFDTETVGLPKDYRAPITDIENWPRMIQIAWMLVNENGDPITSCKALIKPDGFLIPDDVLKVHGITNDEAYLRGVNVNYILERFAAVLSDASLIVGHNISFDRKIVGAELYRAGYEDLMHGKPRICIMMKSTQYCQLPKEKGNGYKWPKLEELYFKLFNKSKEGLHDAWQDVIATVDCFFELQRVGVITNEVIEKELNKTFEESF